MALNSDERNRTVAFETVAKSDGAKSKLHRKWATTGFKDFYLVAPLVDSNSIRCFYDPKIEFCVDCMLAKFNTF